jgi:deazaflavin-dependent oxidoreductase (nitroreductase family)
MAAPSPWLKRVMRAPVGVYGLGLGWVFGHRFLLLTHRGRKSGREYRTMLEVVRWDAATREAIVASGWGRQANWFRNLQAGGAVEVEIARTKFQPEVRPLEVDEAAAVLADYERRNRFAAPILRAALSRLAGFRYDGSEAGRRRLVETLPLVGLRPQGSPAAADI